MVKSLTFISIVLLFEACLNQPGIDLVLMDIKMPVMDGHEATRQIREFNKELIIIAQTAFSQSGDREKAISLGFNDYISKPVSKVLLTEIINRYFNPEHNSFPE